MTKIKSDKIILGERLFDGYVYVKNGKKGLQKKCLTSFLSYGKIYGRMEVGLFFMPKIM